MTISRIFSNYLLKSSLLFCIILYSITLCAAPKKNIFKGFVFDTNKVPISYVVVRVKNSNIYSLTDEKGAFEINVPSGQTIFEISTLGFVKREISVNINKDILNYKITLIESSLALDDVVVTATQVQSKNGTSSYKIGEDAIKQIQAMSLSDIMQLVPGGKITPPSMNSVSQINLRTASESNANAFGTSIVVDGAPLSNDANMQAKNSSIGSSGGTNTANRGIDLREIPSSNIESVEVVSGVASAKYGNITSGTVLVTRKAGKTPLLANFNATPSIYQGGISKGFALNNNLGFLNVDMDYSYSNSSVVDNSYYYQRVSAGARWTATLNKKKNWTNTTSFNYSYQGDSQKKEKDKTNLNSRDVENKSYRFGVNGRADILGHVNYNLNGSYSNQHSFFESQESGPVPMIEATEPGTYFTTYSPMVFMQSTTLEGAPLNIYGRFEASQNIRSNNFNASFLTGIEGSYDKNLGKGRATVGGAALASNIPGSRDAKFHNIPASTIFSAYHEINLNYEKNDNLYSTRIGLRYDNMNKDYNLFSPRISFSAKFFKQLRLRAAIGESYKAPSMMTLYPGPTYFDVTNLSYYANNPAERLAIVTTYKYEPVNNNLKPSKGLNVEFGVDWEKNGWQLRLTSYYKKLTNGISTYNSLVVYEKQKYNIIDTPEGKQPVVEKATGDGSIIYFPNTLSHYANNSEQRSKGLELIVSTPKIAATKTSFNLSGNFVDTKNITNFPTLRSSQYVGGEGKRYGVYDEPVMEYIKSSANLTVIQPIPALRMIVTLVSEFNFLNDQKYHNASCYPIAYYDKVGEYHTLTPEQAISEEFDDLKINEVNYQYTVPPFYPNFHLQIRKELKQGHTISFYANNCFWYNPTYTDNTSKTILRLNGKISFGFAMTLKL